jgi:hypothetical protein
MTGSSNPDSAPDVSVGKRGSRGPNKYGPDPRGEPKSSESKSGEPKSVKPSHRRELNSPIKVFGSMPRPFGNKLKKVWRHHV